MEYRPGQTVWVFVRHPAVLLELKPTWYAARLKSSLLVPVPGLPEPVEMWNLEFLDARITDRPVNPNFAFVRVDNSSLRPAKPYPPWTLSSWTMVHHITQWSPGPPNQHKSEKST